MSSDRSRGITSHRNALQQLRTRLTQLDPGSGIQRGRVHLGPAHCSHRSADGGTHPKWER